MLFVPAGCVEFAGSFIQATPDCNAYINFPPADFDPSTVAAEDAPAPESLASWALDKAVSLAPAPVLRMSPHQVGLTGLRTFVWLEEAPRPITATADVPGLSVTAIATPTRFEWGFGDGSSSVTERPPRPWQRNRPGSLGHLYERDGVYDISVRVVYTAGWRVNGGPIRPLGYFVTSDTHTYPVREVRAVLKRSRR